MSDDFVDRDDALKFLLVDDVDENRALLAKTLTRKFPRSVIIESRDTSSAIAAMEQEKPTVIVAHRSLDDQGPQLIRVLRKVNREVPIIMVSGRESCPDALEAGATAFLNYDAWLRIGLVVEEILSPEYVKPLTTSPFRAPEDFLGRKRHRE